MNDFTFPLAAVDTPEQILNGFVAYGKIILIMVLIFAVLMFMNSKAKKKSAKTEEDSTVEKIKITPMTEEEALTLGITDWCEWTCKPSTFNWHYSEQETAFVYEGDVTVTANGEEALITGNMLVVFPKGMDCVWEVRETIRKVYKFD